MFKPNLSDEAVEEVARSGPEVALAKRVLVQAKQDLRRFRTAQDGLGREMYADAFSWVTSDDFWWPYSFLNVCELLGLSPEVLRTELLAEAQRGSYSYSRRIARRISASVANVFEARRSIVNSRDRPVFAN
jgi:hypothetical protein